MFIIIPDSITYYMYIYIDKLICTLLYSYLLQMPPWASDNEWQVFLLLSCMKFSKAKKSYLHMYNILQDNGTKIKVYVLYLENPNMRLLGLKFHRFNDLH